jgi:hypothetical protein
LCEFAAAYPRIGLSTFISTAQASGSKLVSGAITEEQKILGPK